MRETDQALRITVSGVLVTLLVFAVAAMCVRFGFWQLDRLQQRRERNSEVRERLHTPPETLISVPRDSGGWLYRRVFIHGTFDNDRSIILPGRAFAGTPGAHVLTPVLLPDGTAVLADRGWVPAADGASADLAALGLAVVAVDTAVVLPFPGQESRLGSPPAGGAARADSSFRRVWFAMDELALRGQFPYPLGAIHVRLLPASAAAALPLREPLPALNNGPHLGYAIQWFSFALIAIVGWLVIVFSGRLQRRSSGDQDLAPTRPRPRLDS
jgi:surfeit locus 1 family protein